MTTPAQLRALGEALKGLDSKYRFTRGALHRYHQDAFCAMGALLMENGAKVDDCYRIADKEGKVFTSMFDCVEAIGLPRHSMVNGPNGREPLSKAITDYNDVHATSFADVGEYLIRNADAFATEDDAEAELPEMLA